jgi:hypothetical protein
MLQLENRTPFAANLLLLPDTDAVDTLFAVIRGTFRIGASADESPTLDAEQTPVALADAHYGDPASTSIRVPSDVCLGKPGTDVVLIGTAWAFGEKPTWQMDAALTVGPVTKTLRVLGDRVWNSSAGGAVLEWVAPFVRMPIVWERAFGGSDETDKGPTTEPRNPVGVGFRARHGAKPLHGLSLPNIEDPGAPITSWKDAPPPAGFAPVAPNWQPRVSYAGTYDSAWLENRAPFLPLDFDARFFHVAPAGLVTPTHLRGGEVVELRGVTPSGLLRFLLPAPRLGVTYRLDRCAQERPAALDTIVLEPDLARVTMVWRAALRCDKQSLRVRAVEMALLSAV